MTQRPSKSISFTDYTGSLRYSHWQLFGDWMDYFGPVKKWIGHSVHNEIFLALPLPQYPIPLVSCPAHFMFCKPLLPSLTAVLTIESRMPLQHSRIARFLALFVWSSCSRDETSGRQQPIPSTGPVPFLYKQLVSLPPASLREHIELG